MRSYNLDPLYRSTVGFDGLFRLLDSAMKIDESVPSYPPYNIEKTADDSYRVSMAVAGFAEDELSITAQSNMLVVTGKQKETGDEGGKTFLYRGIAARAFERRFQLADHVYVTGAHMKDGLLHVDLKREVPEAMRPRVIAINAGDNAATTIENKKIN